MFKRFIEWLKDIPFRVKRFFYTVRVDVYPRSPFYPPRAVVSVIFFNKFLLKLKETKTQFTRNYQIDFNHIISKVPAHWIHVHLPDDWWDKVEYALETDKSKDYIYDSTEEGNS